MTRCPACSLEVPENSRYCLGCGAAFPGDVAEPTGPYQPVSERPPNPRPQPTLARPDGQARFATGQLLAKTSR